MGCGYGTSAAQDILNNNWMEYVTRCYQDVFNVEWIDYNYFWGDSLRSWQFLPCSNVLKGQQISTVSTKKDCPGKQTMWSPKNSNNSGPESRHPQSQLWRRPYGIPVLQRGTNRISLIKSSVWAKFRQTYVALSKDPLPPSSPNRLMQQNRSAWNRARMP